jgi:hypothetical protein
MVGHEASLSRWPVVAGLAWKKNSSSREGGEKLNRKIVFQILGAVGLELTPKI